MLRQQRVMGMLKALSPKEHELQREDAGPARNETWNARLAWPDSYAGSQIQARRDFELQRKGPWIASSLNWGLCMCHGNTCYTIIANNAKAASFCESTAQM
jgi:hypothetical protein